MASDDNSEFWLSPNESPAGAQLVAFVGKVSPPTSSVHTPSVFTGLLWPQSPVPFNFSGGGTGRGWCPKERVSPLPFSVALQTGSEWTAPGEFTKFSSQVSKPRR